MKYKHWDIASPCPEGRAALEQSGLSPLLSSVLSARGITDPTQAKRMLSPNEEPLLPPEDLLDMDRAVARIRLALQNQERMAVYGDYDVDGITATCLLTEALSLLGGQVISYIPERMEEGYGLNFEAIDYLASLNVSLIITVDCGITAVDEVIYAKEKGLSVVITDHHACKDAIPAAAAVVDPHRPDCPYPFKGLAGVGVALKLALALTVPEERHFVLSEFCDLAAIGTVADVMPMTGENRAIVQAGLARLNPPRRLGLFHLVRCAGLEEKPVTAVSVGYTLAPRINASGRMGQAKLALELLLTRNPARAEALAEALCSLNRERQLIESEIFTQCVQRLEQSPQHNAIVLADPNWHQGVVGIVASRLTERFAAPAFMICLDQGIGKGSCRSWGGINLFALLQECSHLLENFGGHALAAGFTVREENIPLLSQALQASVSRISQGEDLPSVLKADAVVTSDELTEENVAALERLEPCGAENPRPVLVLTGAQVQAMAQVGRGRHLKMRLESRGTTLDTIFFSTAGTELGLSPGCRVDVAFYPQINEFRGIRSVQLQLVDLRPAPTRAQMEQSIYNKYRRGEPLSSQEAQFLLPQRQEFVDLWRWLKRQSVRNRMVEDTPLHIARSVCRSAGRRREVPARTLLCLDVLEERGLISLTRRPDRLQITIHDPEHKVDLDASQILVQLRQAIHS